MPEGERGSSACYDYSNMPNKWKRLPDKDLHIISVSRYGVWWDSEDVYMTGLVKAGLNKLAGTGTSVFYVPQLEYFNQTFPLTLNGKDLIIGDTATWYSRVPSSTKPSQAIAGSRWC